MTTHETLPAALDGWQWGRNSKTQDVCLIGPDGWTTKHYPDASRAVKEALRRVNSQPKPKPRDHADGHPALERSIVALRAAGYELERDGIMWRVRLGGGEWARHSPGDVYDMGKAIGVPTTTEAPPAETPAAALITALRPADIRTDGGTQARAALDPATVAEYVEAMRELLYAQNGMERIPPIVVFHDGAAYWLADGFHRLAAYQQLQQEARPAPPQTIRADVRQGTRRDAVLYAAGANADHGLRRSAADKERAVLALLQDEEWGQWSDREIARRCKVSHEFVATVAKRHDLTGRASSARKTADGRVMQTSGIAAANQARRSADRLPSTLSDTDSLPAPPEGWVIWRNEGESTIGMRHTSGLKLAGDDAQALVQEAAALARPLAELAGNGWTVLFDPNCPPDLHAYSAMHETYHGIGAHDLPRLALAAWWARIDERDLPDVSNEILDALYLAGYDWTGQAWQKGHERIDPLAATIAELRYIAGLDAPSAEPSARAVPDALRGPIRMLETHDWEVRSVGTNGYRLKKGRDAYETDADGVIATAQIVAAQPDLTPDEVMVRVNAIEDAPPATTTARYCEGGCGGMYGAPGSMVYDGKLLCPRCAGQAMRAGNEEALAQRKAAQAAPAPACAECGKPSAGHRNIGGECAERCAGCATTAETADLTDQLGDQYKGLHHVPELGGDMHKVAWAGGGGGYYAYADALAELGSSARQLRQKTAEAPLDPRSAAVAWLSRMHTTMHQCAPSVMFRLSEMQQAVSHIKALLAGDSADSADLWAVLGDLLLSDERARLLACRGALDAIVAEPTIDTDVYDRLSRRVGDAERAMLAESEATP